MFYCMMSYVCSSLEKSKINRFLILTLEITGLALSAMIKYAIQHCYSPSNMYIFDSKRKNSLEEKCIIGCTYFFSWINKYK